MSQPYSSRSLGTEIAEYRDPVHNIDPLLVSP